MYEQTIHYSDYFNKLTDVWSLLLPMIGNFTHIWMLDSDISLKNTNLNEFFTSWECGSSYLPPIISQPAIISPTRPQAPAHVNYKRIYSDVGFSSVTTNVVEIQAPMIDAGFLHWFITEIVDPYVKFLADFSRSEWGTDCVWCQAANLYTHSNKIAYPQSSRRSMVVPCALIPVPVTHISSKSIRKNKLSRISGEKVKLHYRKKFPMFYKKNWKMTSERLSNFLTGLSRDTLLASASEDTFETKCLNLRVAKYNQDDKTVYILLNNTVV